MNVKILKSVYRKMVTAGSVIPTRSVKTREVIVVQTTTTVKINIPKMTGIHVKITSVQIYECPDGRYSLPLRISF